MRRWRHAVGHDGHEVEDPKIDAFLEEIWTVCERHGLGLSHEDGHGSFLVVSIEKADRGWLMNANDETSEAK